MSTNEDTVTQWIQGIRQGDSRSAQQLWDRYFHRLAHVAQGRLRDLGREGCGEDVALSALKSVMIGVREEKYPDLADRTNLWPLLVTITARKSIDQVRRQLAGKRSASATESIDDLRVVVGRDPSPEFITEIVDQLEKLVDEFDDPQLKRIAHLKLEGYTNEEIAEELSTSTRTVIRKLKRIRKEWEEFSP